MFEKDKMKNSVSTNTKGTNVTKNPKIDENTRERIFEVLSDPIDSPWWKVRIDYGEDGHTEPVDIDMLSVSALKKMMNEHIKSISGQPKS